MMEMVGVHQSVRLRFTQPGPLLEEILRCKANVLWLPRGQLLARNPSSLQRDLCHARATHNQLLYVTGWLSCFRPAIEARSAAAYPIS